MEKGSFRTKYSERDLSGYILSSGNETGAMVIKSSKGQSKPTLCRNEEDILIRYGNPSYLYPGIFEALSFVRQSPLWIGRAIGENAYFGGVDVTATSVTAFTGGRTDPANITSFSTIQERAILDAGTVDAENDATGTIANTPIIEGSLIVRVNGEIADISETGGVFSGTDIDGAGVNTIDYNTGAFDFRITTASATVEIEYRFANDLSAVSHSFYTVGPNKDDLAIQIENVSGSKFTLSLYQKLNGQNILIAEYDYSLIREKNNFGRQLYIMDVFDNNDYLIPVVNDAYSGAIPTITPSIVDFNGGDAGDEPQLSDYTGVWDYFKKPKRYPVRIFMDVDGQCAFHLNTLVQNYQYFAHVISVVPMGNDVDEAVTYRQGLGIDSDNISLYTNWRKIYDIYNDSFAWISNVGGIGVKYAQMEDVYDGLSPAGVDENGHGGQIDDWRTLDMEYDYDDFELKTLDDAQINPVIFDDTYGVMVYGDKTLQVDLSDTSFIHTRRIYNVILETVINGILKKQEFKNNDDFHQLKAKTQTDTFLIPILAQRLIREAKVICDDSNNTDVVKEQKKFILDIIVKATPNSQKVKLRLTRVGQKVNLDTIVPE